MKDGQTRFTTLKEKMSAFQFQFGKAVKAKNARATSHAGKDLSGMVTNAFSEVGRILYQRQFAGGGLKAMRWIADILRGVTEAAMRVKLNTAYWRATRKSCLKLFADIKSRCLTAPA